MRYDDAERPISDVGATPSPLQVNGSPLPVITLMRPMQSESEQGDDVWGWLACIHAHRTANRFGTYYGWIKDLGQFQQDYLADPEGALQRYFKYSGPQWEPTERPARVQQSIAKDIFADE